MSSIGIPIKTLKALLPITSTDETRPALNGICVDVVNKNNVLVACDGRGLAVMLLDKASPGFRQFIIPSWVIKAVPGLKSTLVCDQTANETTLTMGGLRIIIPKNDDLAYPNWQAVLPSEVKGQTSTAVNAGFFASFATVGKRLGYDEMHVQFNGEQAMFIEFAGCCGFFGILMPMRCNFEGNHPNLKLPAWLGGGK